MPEWLVRWRSPDKGEELQIFTKESDMRLFKRLLENRGRVVSVRMQRKGTYKKRQRGGK